MSDHALLGEGSARPSPLPGGKAPAEPAAHVARFHAEGYAIVRNVFGADEVAELAAAFDRVYAEGLAHPRSYRHANLFYCVVEDPALGRMVRYVQWPSYHDPVLNRFRQDKRLYEIVRPLIGGDIKQIINQMHWKPPGAAMTDFAYHQDIRFRRPRRAYRNPETAYVQTAIAVDPQGRHNGALRLFPGSHRLGELDLGDRRVMETRLDDGALAGLGLVPGDGVDVEMAPGDVALWSLYTVHGSGANPSAGDRRLYINGYVRASDCDRGEWTFLDGEPVPLGTPQLVHYEDLLDRPGPFYVDE